MIRNKTFKPEVWRPTVIPKISGTQRHSLTQAPSLKAVDICFATQLLYPKCYVMQRSHSKK